MTDPSTKPADETDERKERDDDAARPDRLERRLDRLTECAAVFVHDLRTPVSVAAGRVQLAHEDDDEEHLEAAADALERVSSILDEWNALVHDEGHNDWEVVELETALRSTWTDLETGTADLLVEDSSPIRADSDALDRLVTNLATNAVRHAGPSVTVRAGTLDDDGFYIEDDGPGIPPDQRDAVFDPGYSSGGSGHGFGLTSVELVAEAHGWDVSVDATKEGGARFEFRGVEVL